MAEKLIHCDACGRIYDAMAHGSCPGCGAGYEYDEEAGRPETAVERKYRLLEEQQEAEKKAKFERSQKELDSQVKKIKLGCFAVILIIAALIFAPKIMAMLGGGAEAAAVMLHGILRP